MVTAGLKGRKSGRGFYTYAEPGSSQVVDDALTPRPAGESGAATCARSARVGVVGSGTMATGIIEVFAKAGYDVTYVTRSQAKVDAVTAAITQVAREGRAARQARRSRPATRRSPASPARRSLDDLAAVDLVVEAVVEDLAVKKALFENLDEICKPGAILATTTSLAAGRRVRRRDLAARRTSSGCTSSTRPR